MTDDTRDPDDVDADSVDLDPDAIDTGEPIAQLLNFELGTSPNFLLRVRRRLERRLLTTQIVSSAWETPKVFLIEILDMLFGWLGTSRDDKGE